MITGSVRVDRDAERTFGYRLKVAMEFDCAGAPDVEHLTSAITTEVERLINEEIERGLV